MKKTGRLKEQMFRMSFRTIARKVRIDLLSEKNDICEMLFAQKRAQKVCRLLLNELRKNNGLTRKEFHQFSLRLAKGEVEPGFKYTPCRFYAQIRATLLNLGLMGIIQRAADNPLILVWSSEQRQRRSETVEVYIPVSQPITMHPPTGLNLVFLTWIICDKWNKEFFEDIYGVKK